MISDENERICAIPHPYLHTMPRHKIISRTRVSIPSNDDAGYRDASCLCNGRSPTNLEVCHGCQTPVSSIRYSLVSSCCQAMMHNRSCS